MIAYTNCIECPIRLINQKVNMENQPGSSNNINVDQSLQNIHKASNQPPSVSQPQGLAPPPPPPPSQPQQTNNSTVPIQTKRKISSRLSKGFSIANENPIQANAAQLRVEKLFNQMMKSSKSQEQINMAANRRVEKLFFQMVKKDLKKRCDTCKKGTDETEEKVIGKKAWLCCLLVILIPFLVFYCHPLCDDNFKDTQFICKECGEEKRTLKARLF